MSISKSNYLNAFKEKNQFESGLQFVLFVKQEQKFRYGKVSYQQFAKQYRSDGWAGRKVIALPAALWCAVVQTTYRFAVFILAMNHSSSFIKKQIFYICRDLEEAFGRIFSIFSDKYGQYLVEESRFQKECYKVFSTRYKDVPPTLPSPQPRPVRRTSPSVTRPAPVYHPPRRVQRDTSRDISERGSLNLEGGNPHNVTAGDAACLTNTLATGSVISRHRNVKMVGGSAGSIEASNEVELESAVVQGAVVSRHRHVKMVKGSAGSIEASNEVELESAVVQGAVVSKHRHVKMTGGRAKTVITSIKAELQDTMVSGELKIKRMVLFPESSEVASLKNTKIHSLVVEMEFVKEPKDIEEVIVRLDNGTISNGIHVSISGYKKLPSKIQIKVLGSGNVGGNVTTSGSPGVVEFGERIKRKK